MQWQASRRRLLALASALPLAACAPSGGARTLRVADVHPLDYPTVQALADMARRLGLASSGTLAMKLYPGGQLGDESDTLELTILGGIDINRVNLAPLTVIEPLTQVLAMPFLFRSIAHMRAVVDGEIGDAILASLARHGLIGLAFYDSGARSIYNALKPVTALDDLRGMKIRVQNSDLAVDMVRALGANPTPMGFGQVYESLLLGTIDGSENNWPSYQDARHYRVARHMTLTEHSMAPEVLVMSKRSWDRLVPADRVGVRAAAQESVPLMRTLWDAREASARAALTAADVQLTPLADRAPFEAAMEPLYARYLADPALAGMVRRIRAMPA
jgi:tripartite ATP-independent transporter DctP family solute receptor